MKNGHDTRLAVMAEKIETINENVTEIKTRMEKDYVTSDRLSLTVDRLNRVEKILYGLISIILTAVVLAILRLVVLK